MFLYTWILNKTHLAFLDTMAPCKLLFYLAGNPQGEHIEYVFHRDKKLSLASLEGPTNLVVKKLLFEDLREYEIFYQLVSETRGRNLIRTIQQLTPENYLIHDSPSHYYEGGQLKIILDQNVNIVLKDLGMEMLIQYDPFIRHLYSFVMDSYSCSCTFQDPLFLLPCNDIETTFDQ